MCTPATVTGSCSVFNGTIPNATLPGLVPGSFLVLRRCAGKNETRPGAFRRTLRFYELPQLGETPVCGAGRCAPGRSVDNALRCPPTNWEAPSTPNSSLFATHKHT